MSARFDTSVVSTTRTRDTLEKRSLAEQIAKEKEAEEARRLEAENERLRKEVIELEEEDAEFDVEPIDSDTVIAEHARLQAESFVKANPDYVVCPENSQTIVAYLTKQRISNPSSHHFQKAFDILKQRGLMITDQSQSRRPDALKGEICPDGKFRTTKEIESLNSRDYAKAFGLRKGES